MISGIQINRFYYNCFYITSVKANNTHLENLANCILLVMLTSLATAVIAWFQIGIFLSFFAFILWLLLRYNWLKT